MQASHSYTSWCLVDGVYVARRKMTPGTWPQRLRLSPVSQTCVFDTGERVTPEYAELARASCAGRRASGRFELAVFGELDVDPDDRAPGGGLRSAGRAGRRAWGRFELAVFGELDVDPDDRAPEGGVRCGAGEDGPPALKRLVAVACLHGECNVHRARLEVFAHDRACIGVRDQERVEQRVGVLGAAAVVKRDGDDVFHVSVPSK